MLVSEPILQAMYNPFVLTAFPVSGSFGLTEENFKALSAASLSKPDNGAYAMESAQVGPRVGYCMTLHPSFRCIQVKLRPQLRGASGARQPSVENRRTVATNQR